jgi:hypothetical protein
MQNNKLLIGGIVGGVAFFFIGWIIYGMLLMSVMAECSSPAAAAMAKEPMEMWAMGLSNLALGFLFAIIYSKYAALPSVGTAMQHGALMGLLMAASMDFSMYSMMNMMSLKGVFIDIAAFAVYVSLGSAVIVMVMGRGNKPAAA